MFARNKQGLTYVVLQFVIPRILECTIWKTLFYIDIRHFSCYDLQVETE